MYWIIILLQCCRLIVFFHRALHKKVVSLNLSTKLISLVTAFLFQVPAGVSSGAPSSSSSTIETVDPGLGDYLLPISKAGLIFH